MIAADVVNEPSKLGARHHRHEAQYRQVLKRAA
jgi:hypothetical protein